MDLQRRKRRGLTAAESQRRFSRRPGSAAGKKGPFDSQSPHGRQRGKGDAEGHRRQAAPFGRKRRRAEDEDIESDSASGLDAPPSSDSDSEDAGETADEVRLRVARQYLKQFSEAAKGKLREGGTAEAASRTAGELAADPAFDSAGGTDDGSGGSGEDDSSDDFFQDEDSKAEMAAKLRQRADEKKLQSRPTVAMASRTRFGSSTFLRGHKLAVTCVALPGEGTGEGAASRHLYTGSKDCCIIRWDVDTGKKEVFKGQRNCFGEALTRAKGRGSGVGSGGHFRPVLSVCVAEDERVFFSAGADHTIRAWDPRASNEKCMFELRSHKGPVTGICLNGGSYDGAGQGDAELLSCSADKSLKSWNIGCRSVLNHFYGHATEVNCIDTLQPNKPITGGSDGTLRNWKLVQDTHTAFPPLGSCVDSVAMLSPHLFCCGTQGGLLSLFNSGCKKPLACVRVHQHDGSPSSDNASLDAANATYSKAVLRATGDAAGVSALRALPFTDALLVGTEGGSVQLWSATQNDRKGGCGSLKPVANATERVAGVVTGLCVSPDKSFAAAAVSTESRLGRWYKSDGAKNGIQIIPIMTD
ncbi:u3 small nucleolar ribonucleoprotein complex-associated [Cyclospora cayetanensis]|uniref:U3 small nucleolar ribonucleoprotein complex-associated n=1 Tax=Cyclospora cayetanensis TaxID=88456 RepID=A0A1D3CSL8_9EIME|nr:u3 small nucleolar ribonucleoprotein complex-associated [Cyclospora cayetanensis]